MLTTAEVVRNAWRAGLMVPAFNVPYLPMVEPLVRAVVDQNVFALIDTARIEWLTFESQGPAVVYREFVKWQNPDYVRLHLDHVPVIDEDDFEVDYVPIIQEALDLGYDSVMIDGSKLPLEANIAATRQIAAMAHQVGVPCEAELGAIVREGAGPLPPYEELFASGMGFTGVEEAARFVRETGCDWLSVAVGNLHGAVSKAFKDQKKTEARLNLDHLAKLRDATGIPLVLHGGSGIQRAYMLEAMKRGIAKVNVATEIRQAYETGVRETGSVKGGQDAVYERAVWMLRDYFAISGSRERIIGQQI